MPKVIRCDCGFVARGTNDNELVTAAQDHALSVHNIAITAEQALAMAEPEDA